jgi:hypothetical protein
MNEYGGIGEKKTIAGLTSLLFHLILSDMGLNPSFAPNWMIRVRIY